jgi:hypothetical protein
MNVNSGKSCSEMDITRPEALGRLRGYDRRDCELTVRDEDEVHVKMKELGLVEGQKKR